jgi:2-haloacid dehalogenase
MTNRNLAIVFDFGGVLLDWNPRYLYAKLFSGDEQAMERFLTEVNFYEWNAKQDAGRSFAEGVEEGCRAHPDYCELLRTYDLRWQESILGPDWGSVAILADLRQAGYSLYGLSNWSTEKYYLVRDQYEFLGWLEAVILSGEVGLVKPDPRIFNVLLDKIERPAPECLLIDDSLVNIETAQAMGFQIIHFQSAAQLRQALVNLNILAE